MGLLVTAPPVSGIDCMWLGACPGADPDLIFAHLVPAAAAAAAAATIV